MMDIKETEERIRRALRPIFVEFDDEKTLDIVSAGIMQACMFIDSLDNSYSPMDKIVVSLYKLLEEKINMERRNLLLNPAGLNEFMRNCSQDDDKYRILGDVITGLVRKETKDYYERFGSDDLSARHFTDDVIASFSTARKVVEEGKADIGIAIGPEGFSYAPMFVLLGMPVLNIHIDEYCKTQDRPYKELDDLSVIEGKDVLLIEDDVKTGRTLKKAHQNIKRYYPKSVSVYLGIQEKRQTLSSVPKDFKGVYTVPHYLAPPQLSIEINKLIDVLSRKYKIFKGKG